MSNLYSRILYSFLLLVSLLSGIKSDSEVIKEQREIAPRPQLKNNFNKTPGEPVITTAITVDDEKSDDNELSKLFVLNYKVNETSERDKNNNGTQEIVRKIRDANQSSKTEMECLSCFANGTSVLDKKCYMGALGLKMKCEDGEQCYVQLHPEFIKRGCIAPNRLNKTFACRCPLCNNKPSTENIFYEYKSLRDWEYDNFLLQRALPGLDLLCKVCETNVAAQVADKNCRLGQNADYMVCGHNQVCYTNINDEEDRVTRGCISRPLYNSYYSFCNRGLCNNGVYKIPNLRSPTQLLLLSQASSQALSSKSASAKVQLNLETFLIGLMMGQL